MAGNLTSKAEWRLWPKICAFLHVAEYIVRNFEPCSHAPRTIHSERRPLAQRARARSFGMNEVGAVRRWRDLPKFRPFATRRRPVIRKIGGPAACRRSIIPKIVVRAACRRSLVRKIGGRAACTRSLVRKIGGRAACTRSIVRNEAASAPCKSSIIRNTSACCSVQNVDHSEYFGILQRAERRSFGTSRHLAACTRSILPKDAACCNVQEVDPSEGRGFLQHARGRSFGRTRLLAACKTPIPWAGRARRPAPTPDLRRWNDFNPRRRSPRLLRRSRRLCGRWRTTRGRRPGGMTQGPARRAGGRPAPPLRRAARAGPLPDRP
jgi:hypothetical protein